ncbi:hypothetical protein C0J52_24738 [Blattella germanica]|nr:hypothetical protein C0J52_24738 [Blattella germanica]
MVWIHGGSLVTGAGHIITGHPDFLVDEDVIVVTFNYRLGILGLFHSAISQSGTALNQWGYQSKNSSINYGYSLATHFGVNLEEKTESVVKKFSTVTAEQLVRYHKQEEHKHASRFELKLGPTTDSAAEENAFLPDTPINIIENGGFNNVPYIVGSNSAEGIAVSNCKCTINEQLIARVRESDVENIT